MNTGTVSRLTLLLMVTSLVAGGLVLAQEGAAVRITTIAPTYPYETLGVVTEAAHVSSGIVDISKPWREALDQLKPGLTRQGRVIGADTVVLTSFQYIPGGGGSGWLVVFGTAIRSKSGGAAVGQGQAVPAVPAPNPGSAGADNRAADLAGTWQGQIVEEGETEPIPIVVSLVGSAGGQYSGGAQLPSKKCEIILDYMSTEGNTVWLKVGKSSKGFRCLSWYGCGVTPTSDGKLQFDVYTSNKEKPKFSGVLVRS